MNPSVAVVIAAFDAERYLAEALASALDQSLAPAEVIVVDDGSRDGTAAVAASFAARDVRLVHDVNRGPGAARNRGVAATHAPLIAFLDADDRWPRERLAHLVAHLADHPDVDVVNGRATCFASPDMDAADRARLAVPSGPQPGWLPGSILLRRRTWLAVGPFDESLRGGELIDWIGRARAQDLAIDSIDDVVLERRVHPASLTVRARDALDASYLEVARLALQRRRERTP